MAQSVIENGTSYPVPIPKGGTGKTNASDALAALGGQKELKLAGATNPSSITISAYGYADVPLNWSKSGHTWLYNAMSYCGSTGGVIVNTWFDGDKLTMTVRNVLNQAITINAKTAYVRVIYV